MIKLLVGVDICSLEEHFLGLSGQLVLFMHLDASLDFLHVALLGSHFALSNRLFLHFLFSLEVTLGLKVAL